MKLPIRTLGLAAAALLIGSALAPVSAQSQQSGLDGQVALRSDGALYLISNGQRRWVATAAATDDEINMLPEGEPIFAGLSPAGTAVSSAGTSKPTASSSTKNTSTKNTSTKNTSGDDDDDDDDDDDSSSSSDDDEELSDDIPVTVVIDGGERIKRGDSRAIEIQTRKDVTCELRVQVPNDDDIEEDSKNADSRGRCKYNVDIPGNTKEGSGKVIGTVREGGRVNRQEVDIRIVK
jgi:hypothetical protein